MSLWTTDVAAALERVRALRDERRSDPLLEARSVAVKRYQHARFQHDYASLLGSPRYGAAARFFLNELYGPVDFERRDAEFVRIVPTMAHVLPSEVMQTVQTLATLHALTEELDQLMARALDNGDVDERSYRHAWQTVGRRPDRERQLSLLLSIGQALQRYTRHPLLLATLRLMRGPAKAAGLARLQAFLETGLAAFAQMRGAETFLATIAENERNAISDYFDDSKE